MDFQDPQNDECYARLLGEGRSLLDIDRDQVIDQLGRHGALLLRGFEFDVEGFQDFSNQFCSNFVHNESPGRRNLNDDGTTQTVDLGDTSFPLHPELSREPWKPDLAFFACRVAPLNKGETTLCDGIEIVRGLRPETREQLSFRTLKHKIVIPHDQYPMWFGDEAPSPAKLGEYAKRHPNFDFTFEENEFVRSYFMPFFHKPMLQNEPAFGSYLLFARWKGIKHFPCFEDETYIDTGYYLEIKHVSDQLTRAHVWQEGDLLMVDNTRFLHGRNEILDVEHREIWTRFGYANFHPDYEKLRIKQRWRNPGVDPILG